MEKSRFGTIWRTLSTRVDLPEPDGAEMMYTVVIRGSAPARELSRYRLSWIVPVRVSSMLPPPNPSFWRVVYWPRGSSLAAENPVSCPLLRPDRAGAKDASHVDRGAPVLPEYRCDRRAAPLPAECVPVRFESRSVPAGASSIARHRFAKPPGGVFRLPPWPAAHDPYAASIRVRCHALLPRAFD